MSDPRVASRTCDLRVAVEGLAHKNPEDSGYVRAYSYGRNEALSAVLALIPEGSVLVTEAALAEALPTYGELMEMTSIVPELRDYILARLRGEK